MCRPSVPCPRLVCSGGGVGSTEKEADSASYPPLLTHRDIEIGKKLGNGRFGAVHMGKMTATGQAVCIKTCAEDPVRFLEEKADVLTDHQHPNVVQLVGVVGARPLTGPPPYTVFTLPRPACIVLELCEYDNLLAHLKRHTSTQDVARCVRMAAEAADGLAYLHGKNCMFVDVAARNCLLTTEGVVKISGFGPTSAEDTWDWPENIYMDDTSARPKNIVTKWTAPGAHTSLAATACLLPLCDVGQWRHLCEEHAC